MRKNKISKYITVAFIKDEINKSESDWHQTTAQAGRNVLKTDLKKVQIFLKLRKTDLKNSQICPIWRQCSPRSSQIVHPCVSVAAEGHAEVMTISEWVSRYIYTLHIHTCARAGSEWWRDACVDGRATLQLMTSLVVRGDSR